MWICTTRVENVSPELGREVEPCHADLGIICIELAVKHWGLKSG